MKLRESLQFKNPGFKTKTVFKIKNAFKTKSAIRKTIAFLAMFSTGLSISTAQQLQIKRETPFGGISESKRKHSVLVNSKSQVVTFEMRDCDTCNFDEFRINIFDQQLRRLTNAFVSFDSHWYEAGGFVETTDGGYIMIGSLSTVGNSFPGFDSDIQVAKISVNGDLQWEKRYTAAGNEMGVGVQQTADGGYLIIANSTSNNAVIQNPTGKNQIWLAKLDANGNGVWNKLLTNEHHNVATDFKKTRDGNYILCGGTNDDVRFGNNASKSDALLMKFNDQGTILWQSHIGGNGDDEQFEKITQDKAGNIFAAGYTSSTNLSGQVNRGEWDGWITKVSNDGVVLSTKLIGGSGNDRLNSIAISKSGLITAGGSTFSNDGDVSENVNKYTIWATSYQDGSNNLKHGFFGHAPENYSFIEDIVIDQYSNIYCVTTSGFGNPFMSRPMGYVEGWLFNLAESNVLRAIVYVDHNNNGWRDANENLFNDGKLEVIKKNSTDPPEYFSSSNGEIIANLDTGVYRVRFISNQPYYTASPSELTADMPIFGMKDSLMVRLVPTSMKSDLAVNIVPHNIPRPGFEVSYSITLTNRGPVVVNNPVIKLVKDSRLTILSASPAIFASNNDTLVWDFGSRSLRDTLHIFFTARLAAPPATAIGDKLVSQVSVLYDQADETPLNNSFVLSEIVGGSFDPNDKSELHAGLFPVNLLTTDKFHYLVRFQNTGTDTAFNIIIRDTLHGSLDISGFEMLAGSHPYTLTIKNGNQLEWKFNNVLLPDSNVNEKASHGYLGFSVKPKSSLVTGDVVTNRASIYFDYNLPVLTNTTSTLITENLLPKPMLGNLQSIYCQNAGIQKAQVRNLAMAPSATVELMLNNKALSVDNDGFFSFDPAILQQGLQTIIVSFKAGGQSASLIASFTVTVPVVPKVTVRSNLSSITSNLTTTVILTATPLSGGGATPLYTFATDRNFVSILQVEGPVGTALFNSVMLKDGDNWIYVRMKSTENCVTSQLAFDSVKITKISVTSIVDIEYPGIRIIAYPNPFRETINLKGLQASLIYGIEIFDGTGRTIKSLQVKGSTSHSLVLPALAKGKYYMRLYDKRNNRMIGTIPIVRQ